MTIKNAADWWGLVDNHWDNLLVIIAKSRNSNGSRFNSRHGLGSRRGATFSGFGLSLK